MTTTAASIIAGIALAFFCGACWGSMMTAETMRREGQIDIALHVKMLARDFGCYPNAKTACRDIEGEVWRLIGGPDLEKKMMEKA